MQVRRCEGSVEKEGSIPKLQQNKKVSARPCGASIVTKASWMTQCTCTNYRQKFTRIVVRSNLSTMLHYFEILHRSMKKKEIPQMQWKRKRKHCKSIDTNTQITTDCARISMESTSCRKKGNLKGAVVNLNQAMMTIREALDIQQLKCLMDYWFC